MNAAPFAIQAATPKQREATNALLELTFTAILTIVCFATMFATKGAGFSWLFILAIYQISPFLISLARKRQDFLSNILLAHILYYVVGKYQRYSLLAGALDLPIEANNSVFEQFICTALIVLIVTALRVVWPSRQVKLISLNLRPAQMFIVLGISSLTILSNVFFSFEGAIHSKLSALLLVLVLSAEVPTARFLQAFSQLLLFLICVHDFLVTGMFTFVAAFVASLFIFNFLRRAWGGVIFASFVFLVLMIAQPAKSVYRSFIWEPGNELTLSDRIELMGGLLAEPQLPELENTEDMIAPDVDDGRETDKTLESLSHGLSRFGDDSLESALKLTPSSIPFWDGETYIVSLFIFVPRALYPDKPVRDFNRFGRLYGIIDPEDYGTSVALNYLAEGYINYGHAGLYGAATLFGFLVFGFEFLARKVGKQLSFAYVLVLLPMTSLELDMGSLIHATVITLTLIGCATFLLKARIPMAAD